MEGLETTNLMLSILAIASVVQVLVLVGVAIGAFKAYQSMTHLIEAKLTPSIMRLEGLLANLEHTAAVVRTRTEHLDGALASAGHAASRVSTAMWPRAAVVASIAGGVMGAVRRWRAARGEGRRVKVIAG